MPQINRIIVYARDLEKTADFYARHFGFQARQEPGDRIVELVPEKGGTHLLLHQAGKKQKLGQVFVKLVFDVADIRTFHEKAAQNGLEFGAIHDAGGYQFSNAKDPDGNSIQISSRAFKAQESQID